MRGIYFSVLMGRFLQFQVAMSNTRCAGCNKIPDRTHRGCPSQISGYVLLQRDCVGGIRPLVTSTSSSGVGVCGIRRHDALALVVPAMTRMTRSRSKLRVTLRISTTVSNKYELVRRTYMPHSRHNNRQADKPGTTGRSNKAARRRILPCLRVCQGL